jgi:hypothetical protein
MPIQGDQRASSPRSKIDSGRAILPSISGERRLPHSQRLLCLRVPKCEYPSDGEEEEREEEEEEEEEDQRGGGGSATDMSHLVDPDPDYPSDSEEEEGEEEEEEEEQQQPPIDDTPRKKSRR